MKKLISILGFTTMTVNSLVVPIQNVNHKEEALSIKSNLKISKQNNIDIAEQWYLNIADTKQETILKDNLLSAISLKDNQINFDLNKINKILWNDDSIYNLISNPEYTKNLQLMYDAGNLQFIDGKPQFIENSDYYGYNGVWTESHWYWFGYWKLHIGHVQCQKILGFIDYGIEVAGNISTMLEYFPLAAGVVSVITAFVIAHSWIFQHDKGNGIWMGFWALTPYLGWGSD